MLILTMILISWSGSHFDMCLAVQWLLTRVKDPQKYKDGICIRKLAMWTNLAANCTCRRSRRDICNTTGILECQEKGIICRLV